MKSIEGYTHRQCHIEKNGVDVQSKSFKTMLKLFGKEIIVFEDGKNTQVIDDAEPKEKLGFISVFGKNKKAIDVIQQGAEHEQPHEFPAPPTIKKIACSQYQSILQP
jgi:hypothetical protein